MAFQKRGARSFVIGLLLVSTLGCATVPKRRALPTDLADRARIPGLPEARAWGDEVPESFPGLLELSAEELQERFSAWFGKGQHYLAISGGGAGGAFGAGLLKGWTEAGDRPEFQLVTGISTGALTAPFAFLGPDYDHYLEEIYTSYSTRDLLHKRSLINTFTSDAMYGTQKLEALIARYYDREIIDAIAEEARKGRVLNIGTTNLDVERPVIWRVSAIAASDHPQRVELIQKIILASASIPAAFPPVAFEVEADGQIYDEIHVDGGTASQVFLYPTEIDWSEVLQKLQAPGDRSVYVIRNARLDPAAAIVNRKLLPIAGRSINSLIRTQGIGDLYRIFAQTERDGLDFHLAYIPASFDDVPDEVFDREWMQRLFALGYELGKAGYSWDKAPPGFEVDSSEE